MRSVIDSRVAKMMRQGEAQADVHTNQPQTRPRSASCKKRLVFEANLASLVLLLLALLTSSRAVPQGSSSWQHRLAALQSRHSPTSGLTQVAAPKLIVDASRRHLPRTSGAPAPLPQQPQLVCYYATPPNAPQAAQSSQPKAVFNDPYISLPSLAPQAAAGRKLQHLQQLAAGAGWPPLGNGFAARNSLIASQLFQSPLSASLAALEFSMPLAGQVPMQQVQLSQAHQLHPPPYQPLHQFKAPAAIHRMQAPSLPAPKSAKSKYYEAASPNALGLSAAKSSPVLFPNQAGHKAPLVQSPKSSHLPLPAPNNADNGRAQVRASAEQHLFPAASTARASLVSHSEPPSASAATVSSPQTTHHHLQLLPATASLLMTGAPIATPVPLSPASAAHLPRDADQQVAHSAKNQFFSATNSVVTATTVRKTSPVVETPASAASSPLASVMDVFGAASQYLMRFKPSSLIGPGSLAFNSIPSSQLDAFLVANGSHDVAQSQQAHLLALPLQLNGFSTSQKTTVQSTTHAPSLKGAAGGFLARLTGGTSGQPVQRREDGEYASCRDFSYFAR